MFSLEDEQDDNSIFDQLKSIKPFTIDQLYLLHPDVSYPPTTATSSAGANNTDQQDTDINYDKEIYQNLVEYEQLKNKLAELRSNVKKLHKNTFDHVDNAWILKEESTRKIAMCQSGKIAETTFKYKQAHINSKQLEIFSLGFTKLSDVISKDYIYYSFESQMKRNKIVTQLSISYQNPNPEDRRNKLKSVISTLIEFVKHLGDSKSDFVVQCRKWLRALASKFLEGGRTEDHRFIISQFAKGPVGTADWTADLIECKPFEQVVGFESVPQYITHCSALLSELFCSLKSRIKQASAMPEDNIDPSGQYQDQNWSLIDPRFNCSEELSLSSAFVNVLSEADVIKLCLRIPVSQIFKAYVEKCLTSNEFRLETDKNYEYIMLKLLTIGTIIIKTYQTGLETFNSIQYGNLIEYLSSQIRCTVIILSDQWTEFKCRLRGVDDALLMRLQVEYDNFILRSILIILELRESGIWRHLSRIEPKDTVRADDSHYSWTYDSLRPAFAKVLQVTGLSAPTTEISSQHAVEIDSSETKQSRSRPAGSLTYEFSVEWFREVSEPMLWHILWQFYHSAFISSCDYHSDNYWLEKFQEKSVVYLFVNKIRDSPPGECSYLLNSITSMLLSRTRQDSKLVNFIATEIFNLSFKYEALKDKVTKKGIKSLIRCAEKFPNLISTYLSLMVDEVLDNNVVELIKRCSLCEWLCTNEEMDLLAGWLVECPIDSPQNKVARLIISKLLLNSPDMITEPTNENSAYNRTSQMNSTKHMKSCFVDLKLRRRIALLLYEASVHHLPENNEFGPKSLGASVEVAFGELYCERNVTAQNNLLELATDNNYQQFYVWAWRLLFTLRLHILNQPETDWNDVQSRSGTSRSIKNTVLLNDSFHPAPSIQDSECLSLSVGVKNQNPMASYIYLVMTDATWQFDTLNSCLLHLNVLANSGHLTPSVMAVKLLTICHLNDISESVVKDKQIIEYFTTIIISDFDATRLASLIAYQLDHLKQFRQLQLSQFYINVFLEVEVIVTKQISSSWFSSNELALEKVACLLDYIVKFNFATQRLEIIRKFYDCSCSIQGNASTTGWFGSLLASNSLNANSTRRDYVTNLHALTQKFKKYIWLRWVTTECDALRLEKIWEDIVVYLSSNEDANLDAAIKKCCPQVNASMIKSTLPIYSWIKQIFDIMESDLNHPLCPLIWYNFFLNYFANSLNGVSVGFKLVPQETITRMMSRLDSLFNYHLYKHRNWASTSGNQQNSLAQLYRAYKLWLQDPSLRDAYVDIDRLKDEYSVPLLKAVMESSTEDTCLQYVDFQTIETQNRNLMQIWSTATYLTGNQFSKEMMFVDSNVDKSMDILTSVDDEASDAASLIVKPYKTMQDDANRSSYAADGDEELNKPLPNDLFEDKYRTLDEIMDIVKRNFHIVFEESTLFGLNLCELDKTKSEIIGLVQQLYANKKREFVKVVPCIEGHECPGPARIRLEAEEAFKDERKSQCIQDRRRQCQELIGELLLMPRNRTVLATVVIEDSMRLLVSDLSRSKIVIESLLKWISETDTYKQLNGSYYVANHLLKTVLEILSNTQEADAYNSALINVCLDHPESVQIFSPHLSPSACSNECFLKLYQTISSKQDKLGPMAMFVLLSKFDINSWLKNINSKTMHHESITATCLALRDMGKQPEDSHDLTFDLFKRHLQVELAAPDRRKPEEISLVLSKFLTVMDEQSLAPSLWADFMAILGLERNVSNRDRKPNKILPKLKRNSSIDDSICEVLPNSEIDEITITSIFEDVARLADCQTIFDYHSLCYLMQTISHFINQKQESIDITVLELYQDYLDQFSVVILGMTFMWLKLTSEQYPDNHDLIWTQFIELWYNWVFLKKNCQNVSKANYSLLANYFVSAIRYMIHKIPDNTQAVLQSMLSILADYVAETKQVVYLELTILQRCLKNLPWASLILAPCDFEHLAKLSEQKNYNISDLVSHIIMQIDANDSLTRIYNSNPAILPQVIERLVLVIILQSAHLKGYRLHGRFFGLVPADSIMRLASMILPRMEFVNLEHSQNNKLLVNLLRFMCIKMDFGGGGNDESISSTQQFSTTIDSFNRSIIYAQFVSNYLVDLIKRHPTVVKNNKSYLYAVMDNSLQDLKLLSSPDLNLQQKTSLYENLLECCSCDSLENGSRLLLAKTLVESTLLKNRPIVVLEILHAVGQILRDGQVLVYMIETLINLYLNMNGHYEKVWKSFCLKVLPSDIYLNACIEERTSLALLVYFESLYRGNQSSSEQQKQQDQNNVETISTTSEHTQFNNTRIWSSFFHWLAQLTSTVNVNNSGSSDSISQDAKLLTTWLRMLDMLEPNLQQFLYGDPLKVAQHAKAFAEVASDQDNSQLDTDSPPSQPNDGNKEKSNQDSNLVKPNSPQGSSDQSLLASHRCLIELVKQLISLYNSINSSGLWSYLKSSVRNQQSTKFSITALAVACFLADRTLTCLNALSVNEIPTHLVLLREEVSKLRKSCLSKLETARKSKSFIECSQFIETLIESVQRNDKVQYCEGLELITTYVRSAYNPSSAPSTMTATISSSPKNMPMILDNSNYTYISKILPSFDNRPT